MSAVSPEPGNQAANPNPTATPAPNSPPAAGQPTVPVDGNPPAPGHWFASIEGLDPDVTKWVQDKAFADLPTALKSGMHADRVARERNVLSKPAADGLESWDGWKELGWVEDRASYGVQASDEMKSGFGSYNDGLEKAFADAAHKHRVPVSQANAILGDVLGSIKASFAATAQAGAQSAAELKSALEKEWGADLAKNQELARRAAQTLGVGVDDMSAMEKITGSPGLVRLFHKIGGMLGEDKLVTPSGSQTAGAGAANAKAELMRMNNDPETRRILSDTGHPRYQEISAARAKLYEILGSEK